VALAQQWQCISRDYPWLITCTALYTGLRAPEARTTAETVVKSGVAPMDDHEMFMNQPGLREQKVIGLDDV